LPFADFAGNCEKRLNRRPLLVAWPGERQDRGLRIANRDVGDVCARVVPGDRRGHEADAAPGGHKREDLQQALGLGRDSSGKAVALLLGEPPGGWARVLDHRSAVAGVNVDGSQLQIEGADL
jgi:hypothetical protein